MADQQKYRILCIDDEPDILTVLKIALSAQHDVVGAESGIEALRIIEAAEPDFIICDVMMPELDGYDTVSSIRKMPRFAMTPIFFLTAHQGKDAAQRGYDAGCNLYLYKPFDAPRLIKNIDYFTKESELPVLPKKHTFAGLEDVLGPYRRGEAEPPKESAPTPPPAQQPAAQQRVIVSLQKTDAELRAEREEFEADRKRREEEYWKRRYAHIQTFIDENI